MRVVSVQSGNSDIEISVKPGSLLGYHKSAQGKIALAYGGAELFKSVCSAGLVAPTPQTITSAKALEKELTQIRKQGWAPAPNAAMTGLNALAVPIFSASGQVVTTMAIVDSVQFIPGEPTPAQIETLLNAGLSIRKNRAGSGSCQPLPRRTPRVFQFNPCRRLWSSGHDRAHGRR